MTNKIAIRVKPLKRWADVSNMTRHGKREDPSRHVNRDHTHQNIHFSFVEIEHQTDERGTVTQHGDFGVFEHDGLNGLDIGEQFQNLAEESGASWRKNAIVGTEMLFIASPGFFKGERGSEERRDHARDWARDCISELRRKYPGQLACARLDLDETTPHLSVFMLPMYEKAYKATKRTVKRKRAPRKTISHNQVFGTPESLSELQDWAAAAMKRRGHQLERGERKENKGPDHKTPEAGRQLIAAAEQAAQDTLREAESAAQRLRDEAEAEVGQMHQKALQDAQSASEGLLRAAREEADQIKREATPARLKALQEENAELRKVNQSLNDFVDSIRNTLSAALGDRWEALKKKINDTWQADPRHPNYKPEPPSQSYSSGPSGP